MKTAGEIFIIAVLSIAACESTRIAPQAFPSLPWEALATNPNVMDIPMSRVHEMQKGQGQTGLGMARAADTGWAGHPQVEANKKYHPSINMVVNSRLAPEIRLPEIEALASLERLRTWPTPPDEGTALQQGHWDPVKEPASHFNV